MDYETEICGGCGEPKPPGGGDLCPGCEDLVGAAMTYDHPPADPVGHGRVPPHGNTTR